MKNPIYLDYAATTPVLEPVFEAMRACLMMDGHFANPTALTHSLGLSAADVVERARFEVSSLVGCDPSEIIFTSGATESDNLAIKGAAYALRQKGQHLITMATEHKAVLETCYQLEQEGFRVTYLKPLENGLITLEMLEHALCDDTVLVSIMHVNNELGVIQDIAAIGQCLRARKICFHVDAAQSAGKLPICLKDLNVDFMSFSAHKVYGPKGVGALYVRGDIDFALVPITYGGGQEKGLRSGTLATHQIAGMGKAFALARDHFSKNNQHTQAISNRFIQGVQSIPDAVIHADRTHCIPNIVNFRIEGVNSSKMLAALPEIALSVGSACNSKSHLGSHALKAIGLSSREMHSAFRASFGCFNTLEEIDFVIERLKKGAQVMLKKQIRGQEK